MEEANDTLAQAHNHSVTIYMLRHQAHTTTRDFDEWK